MKRIIIKNHNGLPIISDFDENLSRTNIELEIKNFDGPDADVGTVKIPRNIFDKLVKTYLANCDKERI